MFTNTLLLNDTPYALKKHSIILDHFINAGGPAENDFSFFSDFVEEIGRYIREGFYSADDLNVLRKKFDTSFKEKTLQGRALAKPAGYAGDYLMIDRLMTGKMTEDDNYLNWDKYFFSQSAPRAVRNRLDYFIKKVCELNPQKEPFSILNVASGPGRDLFELFKNPQMDNVSVCCVEHDTCAIEYSKDLNNKNSDKISYINRNIFRYRTDQNFDFIWSGGVFDYFNDKVFVAVLKKLYSYLADEGTLIVGNFKKGNPSQGYMEIFGEWVLQYRSADDLHNLAIQAGIPEDKIQIEHEASEVNLFLRINM